MGHKGQALFAATIYQPNISPLNSSKASAALLVEYASLRNIEGQMAYLDYVDLEYWTGCFIPHVAKNYAVDFDCSKAYSETNLNSAAFC